ncbi:Glycosyl transferase group 1 [Burkholderia multivorans]
MKIGHYMTGIWDHGGVATYIRRVSDAQRASGHELHFFDTHASANADDVSKRPTIVRDANHLYATANEMGIEILHLHTDVSAAPGAGNCRVVRTLHGHSPYCPSGTQFLRGFGRPCGRVAGLLGCSVGHVFGRCGSVRPAKIVEEVVRSRNERHTLSAIPVIAVSAFLKNRMIAAGYPSERIAVLHLMGPAVAEARPIPDSGVPRLVFLGRITPAKGLDWLLRALARTKVPVHLDIGGSGPAEQDMIHFAKSLGVADRVTFHGWLSPERVAELLTAARSIVFPSMWHEPGGTVAFESMSFGRPVIVSAVGGMPEVVRDGENGLLVAPGDEVALANAIERLALDRPYAEQLGSYGRKIVNERFTLAAHVEKLEGLYRSAIAGTFGQS